MRSPSLRPWKVASHGDTVLSAKGEMICRVPNNPENGKNWDADREFIVKAVNNHDALVEALKFATEILESYSFSRGIDPRTATPESAIGRCRGVLAVVGSTLNPVDK